MYNILIFIDEKFTSGFYRLIFSHPFPTSSYDLTHVKKNHTLFVTSEAKSILNLVPLSRFSLALITGCFAFFVRQFALSI